MNYQVNDTVLYGAHGVCTIQEIVERNVTGTPMQYYVLKPIYDPKSTICVPVENQALTAKMRRVLSAAEIYDLIKAMPHEPGLWIANDNERKERYKEILAYGDRVQLIKLIKAIYEHKREQEQKGRKLHISDERFFHEAEKMLYDEFALVLQIQPDQVLPFILEQIQLEGRNKQQKSISSSNPPFATEENA